MMKLRNLVCTSLAGMMLLCGCSAGNATVMRIGDNTLKAGAIKFLMENAGSADKKLAADNLKAVYLIKEIADKSDITLADDDALQVRKSIASFKSNLGGKTETDKLLKSYGLDDDILETFMSSSYYEAEIADKLTVEDPTDEEMKQYFQENYLRAKHVLISSEGSENPEETAQEVLERAKNGEDFDALIEEYGEDPGTASNPDGYVFTNGEMVPEFENAVKSVEAGEFVICESSYGYHVIQRLALDETPELFDTFFTNSMPTIQAKVASEKKLTAMENLATELGIIIEVDDEAIAAIKLDEKDED